MAESQNPRTSKHTTPDVEQLKVEAAQARAAGDDTRAAQLDEQIRQAETK